jgi:hypothetical protein
LGINANYKALSSFQIGINNATFANTKPFHPYNAVARHGVDTVLQSWPTRLLSVRKLFGQVRICTETFDATFQQRDDQNWQLQSKPLWL